MEFFLNRTNVMREEGCIEWPSNKSMAECSCVVGRRTAKSERYRVSAGPCIAVTVKHVHSTYTFQAFVST
jgi:hypothetical protein